MDGSIGLHSSALLLGDVDAETNMHCYRGALISLDDASGTFSFALEGFPLIGWCGLTCRDDITVLVDAWLDRGELLSPLPKHVLPKRSDAVG